MPKKKLALIFIFITFNNVQAQTIIQKIDFKRGFMEN